MTLAEAKELLKKVPSEALNEEIQLLAQMESYSPATTVLDYIAHCISDEPYLPRLRRGADQPYVTGPSRKRG